MKGPPFREARGSVPKGDASDGHDVRGLQALLALDHLERDALTFGQSLVPIHSNRREVNEDVLTELALDEAVALLVREPLDSALCQLRSSVTTETTATARAVGPT